METAVRFFEDYGIFMIVIFAFTEYLNIPAIPGGVILPAAGVTAKLGYADFWVTLIAISVAGLIAELIIYGISYVFSDGIKRFCMKRKKTASVYKKTTDILDKHGAWGLFLARLIPIFRSFVSIPAGLLGMDIKRFIPISLAGNICYVLWNMALGYFLASVLIS